MSEKQKGYRQFMLHRRGAERRGISFEFTYDEWVAWWEKHLGDDWLNRRGKKLGQYVMARYYDSGPYAAHNVKCITHSANSREQINAKKLTKEQVTSIYMQLKEQPEGIMNQLAKQYGIKRDSIRDIKRKKTWRLLTDKLDKRISSG